MGLWKLVAPEATTNLVTNPSFGTNTDGYNNTGANTRERSTDQAKFGEASLKCIHVDNQVSTYLIASAALFPSIFSAYTLSCWVYVPSNWDGGNLSWIVDNLTGAAATNTIAFTDGTDPYDQWVYMETALVIGSDVVGGIKLEASLNPTSTRFIYVDGVQVEQKAYATTFCDGEQDGCSWNLEPHASTSTRLARAYQGGRPLVLSDDLSVHINDAVGIGMPALNTNISELGLSDGGLYQSTRVRTRNWQLISQINGTSLQNLLDLKETFLQHISPRRLGASAKGDPVRFIYTGDTEDLYIDAVYTGGAEFSGRDGFTEIFPIRLSSPHPYFRTVGNSASVLADSESVTLSYATFRDSNGDWNVMGPQSGGTVTDVRSFAATQDGLIWLGGLFGNWDGNANSDHIVTYDSSADSYTNVGTGANGRVHSMEPTANGTLYVGGAFTLIDGLAVGYVASYTTSSGWFAMATGVDALVRVVKQGPDGDIYVGGDFTLANGITVRNITRWDHVGWNALGPPSSAGNVFDMGWDLDGNLYIVGAFVNLDGIGSADYIAKWDGSNWSAVTTEVFNGVIRAIAFDNLGGFYVGGSFTTYNSITYNGLAYFNGSTFVPLSTGVADPVIVQTLEFDDDGRLWVGGDFKEAGGNLKAQHVAIWNGASFEHIGVDLPSAPIVYRLYNNRSRMFIGFDTSGTAVLPGTTTVTNSGSAYAYPVFHINRDGGSTANLQHISNLTTNKKLSFGYDLVDGETLSIDLRPGRRKMVSSIHGERWDILPYSDVAEFVLATGDNEIDVFVLTTGTPTMTTWITWERNVIGVV